MMDEPGDGEWGEMTDHIQERIEEAQEEAWERKEQISSRQAELEQVAHSFIHRMKTVEDLLNKPVVTMLEVQRLVELLAAQRATVLEEFRVFLAAVPCVCAHSNIHGSQEFDRHHESWCPKLKADRKLASLT